MKFRKKGDKDPAPQKKKGHSSPMQKRDWAKGLDGYEEAVPLLTEHVRKGAAWSGDELYYLNALWDACSIVARELGYLDEE